MKKYCGKKLLILGQNSGTMEILKYAKENGAYVIVSDNISYEKSKIKKLADEYLSISTAEIHKLADYVKKHNVDGVIAGISEFNLMQAMLLSDLCGLPYYCTKEQWDLLENKKNFRELCIKYKVPCPKTYSGNQIEFPCVLKPVDASSSKGVFICEDKKELDRHMLEAKSFASNGDVIIEEFAEGVEFSAHYTIANGKAALSSIDNRYPIKVHEGNVTSIPIARIYPSKFINDYLEKVNQPMINLCEKIGLTDAIIFIQGIYNSGKKSFYIFEGGLRSAGELPCRITSVVNEANTMQVIIDHNLLGYSDYDILKEDPFLKNKTCGTVSFVAKSGKVKEINGLEEAIKFTPSIINYECRYDVGDQTPDTDTLRQIFMRFVMICDSKKDMVKDIDYINKHIDVLDDDKNSIVIKMDPERINGLI